MTYTKDNIEIVPYPSTAIARDLTGVQTEGLIVLGFAGRDHRSIALWWGECRRCGLCVKVRAECILKRKQKSCGCAWKDVGDRTRTHGMTHTQIYNVWYGMVKRCTRENNFNYSEYGGRGITVCDRWLKFENFYEDMGERPSPKHTLERVGNNGNYCPENCIWALPLVQANNKRSNVWITFDGKTMTLAQWNRHLGYPQSLVNSRLRKGWSVHRTLTTSPEPRKPRASVRS